MKTVHTLWMIALVFTAAISVTAGVMYGPRIQARYDQGKAQLVAVFNVPTVIAEKELKTPQEPAQPSLGKQFEVVLNGFLQDLDSEARAYKTKRKIADDLVKPFNLRAPEYVAQNYELLQTVSADLRMRMENVVHIFTQANANIESLLVGYPPETQGPILTRWESVQDGQLDRYLKYLAFDDELLKAYDRLLAFYLQNSDALYYDIEADQFYIEDDRTFAAHQVLLQRIKDLKKQRNKALTQSG